MWCCNQNLNQCYTGPYYPMPICTCYRQIYCLLNNSGNTIINPVPVASWAYFSSATTQTVAADGNVLLNYDAGSGSDIINGTGGVIYLTPGTYRISYNSVGTIPAGGTLELALYLSDTEIPASRSLVTGTAGASANLSGNVVVTVLAGTSGMLRLSNPNTESQSITSANLSITKISR